MPQTALPILPAAGIDAAWLTAALRQGGALPHGIVAAMTAVPVGNGLVGTSIRFTLRYDGAPPDAPRSVVGKFPATDATSRQSAALMGLYRREAQFYRDIAPRAGLHTPRVLAQGFDAQSHDFFLLFEDLAPARPGDQLAGCTAEDAAAACGQIALLHAAFWDKVDGPEYAWAGLPGELPALLGAAVAPAAELFLERFAPRLAPAHIAAVRRMIPLGPRLLHDPVPRATLLHGDFRLDNVLFDTCAGRHALSTLDWQTLARGRGTLDVAYFLGSGLSCQDRAAHERDVLRLYHTALCAQGVSGYSWVECWRDYRRHSLNGLFMAVFSAANVARTARADDMFLVMAQRHAEQALAHDAFALWEQA